MADEEHRRREQDAGACNQESQAGVRDSSEGQPLTGGKVRAADPAAGAKAVPPPLWLSGQLPANQRGSNNQRGQPRGGRGGHTAVGSQQAAGRGANPRGMPRGGARGGRPGRWGRW